MRTTLFSFSPRSRTVLSKDLAQSWANAVEERKNKVGEKTLIKGETVSIEKYSRKDLIEITE